jgi:hypothetical protein
MGSKAGPREHKVPELDTSGKTFHKVHASSMQLQCTLNVRRSELQCASFCGPAVQLLEYGLLQASCPYNGH